MTDLSPQVQAIVDAYENTTDKYKALAAVLRAAADQCKIEWNYHPDYPETESVVVVSDLLDIANEMENV